MAKFQLIVSDPKSRSSKATSLEGAKAQALVGRGIGDVVDGKILGVGSLKLRITGGTDKDGVPMRSDVQGGGRKTAVLAGGVGYKPRHRGERRRKLVRGRVITEETLQVNSVIVSEAPAKEEGKK